jgi:hypothetical protein
MEQCIPVNYQQKLVTAGMQNRQTVKKPLDDFPETNFILITIQLQAIR